MGHCYSLDLRVRVADFVEAGHSCRAAARVATGNASIMHVPAQNLSDNIA